MKVIVGIGDSWTQGQGGVSLKHFEEWGGRVDRYDAETEPKFLHEEIENSWVNVLTRDYFPDYTSINLGMRGYGNRGAVKNLYNYPLPNNISGGCLIFMLSSIVRFDISHPNSFLSSRRKLNTLYGAPELGSESEKWYFDYFTTFFGRIETLYSLLEAQMIAKSYNLDFYFASAFDLQDDLRDSPETHYNLSTQLNWDNYLTPNTHYMEYLNELNGTPNRRHDYYLGLDWPDRYITNCAHPTIEGYKEIAKDLASKLKL